MAFSHTVGGTTFTDASFQGNAYADEATGFPKALEKMVEHVANAYHGTSTNSLTVGAGAKTLTISNTNGQIPAFALGMPVRIARTSDPAGLWMQGEITVWDGATGVATINVDATMGSGSFSDWTITVGGHLTAASGTPPLAVSQGGTGTSTAAAARDNLEVAFEGAVSGVLETNANFFDGVIFGPAIDGVPWSYKTAAATASVMLASIETAGEVNIWDLTANDLDAQTPLATAAISGVSAATSIDACMGYIIVGHEGGITIIDPHDGSWAERTQGWPRSLSTSTTPALNDNDVIGVAAGFSDKPYRDPRTEGDMPTFAVKYGSGTYQGSVIKEDGNVWDLNNTTATADSGIDIAYGRVIIPYGSGQLRQAGPISAIAGNQSVNPPYMFADNYGNEPYNVAADADVIDSAGRLTALGAGEGFGLVHGFNRIAHGYTADDTAIFASITRDYNTGYAPYWQKGIWLANSKSADRSGLSNTLTENGTVTEAVVETGAELKKYSGFSSSNYLSRAYDADLDFATVGVTASIWFKTLNNITAQKLVNRDDPADVVSPFWAFSIHATTGKIQWYYYTTASSTGNTAQSVSAMDDGVWHMATVVHDIVDGTIKMYVDGLLHDTETHGATGNYTNASAELWIGEHPQPAQTAPADETDIALFRVSQSVATAAQVRQMYEAERGMFEANAKCLLQSGATDAVLDVSVDPISHKIAVTQADAAMIFDGLAINSEPSIAPGGNNWKHLRSHGDDLVQINDANLFASIAAKDLRGELEALRALKAGLSGRVDLSKAKAWVIYDQTGTPSIEASYNVSGVEDLATGQFIVTFGVPFKHRPSATWSSDRNGDGVMNIDGNADRWGTSSVRFTHFHNTSGVGQDAAYSIVFFGELDNE
jgi:hypothetical protein